MTIPKTKHCLFYMREEHYGIFLSTVDLKGQHLFYSIRILCCPQYNGI